MTLLRTETQVVLHDLCVLVKTSLDFYQGSLPVMKRQASRELVKNCIERRQQLTGKIEAEIRALDDLPPEPDSEREAGQQLFEKIGLVATDNPERELLEYRLTQEKAIREQIQSFDRSSLSQRCLALRDELLTDISNTIDRLEARVAEL